MSVNNGNLNLGKTGKYGQIQPDNLKGGIKREQIKDPMALAIFDKLAGKDGILDDKEIAQFRQEILSAAKNEKMSKREAKNFLKDKGVDTKEIKSEDLFNFLSQIDSISENSKIERAEVITDANGKERTVLTSNGGNTVETIFDNNTSTIVSKTENEEVTEFYEDKELKRAEAKDNDGNFTTTEYQTVDGKPVKKSIHSENSDGTKIVDVTCNTSGEPVQKTVQENLTVSEYAVNGDKETLTKRTENKGLANETVSTYEYGENNTVVETKTGNGKTVKTTSVDGKPVKIEDGNKTTNITYNENGRTETMQDTDGNSAVTEFNNDGKRLEQTKTVDGKEYKVNYDGQGNTKVIVQNGETIDAIAKKFGCSPEQLKELNAATLNGKKYFNVGAEIKVPGELEADAKELKGRKSAEETKADFARDEQIRQQKAAAKREREQYYKSLGLQDHKGAGEKITGRDKNGKEFTFTKVGNATHGRTIATDKKGNIYVVSNGVILKNDWAQFTSNKKMSEDGRYAYLGSRNDGHNRQVAVTVSGQQVVMSHDGKRLDDSYVQGSDKFDMIKAQAAKAKTPEEAKAVIKNHASVSNENVVKVKGGDGKVWYFDTNTGKTVNLTKQEAAAITKEIDDAADGWFLGLGTDEQALTQANKKIDDPAVLAEINKTYEARGHKADGNYKSAYEQFLSTEIQDNEVYVLNADLVNNGAILDQDRRDEIISTNVIKYGKDAENRNAGLRAISNKTDYDNLQANAAKHNQENGIKGHFKDQDALQALLYNQTEGNAVDMDSANRALIDPNENFIEQEEINRIKAENGVYYVEQGNNKKAMQSHDSAIYAEMDKLLPNGKKVKDVAAKSDLMIAGYGNFTDEEIAKEVAYRLRMSDSTRSHASDELHNSLMDAQYAPAQSTVNSYQNAEDDAVIALQLLKNDKIMNLVKKELGADYDKITGGITQYSKGKIDFSKVTLATDTQSNLSAEQIKQNKQHVEALKRALGTTENSYRNSVDAEGFKQDFVHFIREGNIGATTRADMDNYYQIANSAAEKLELAAEGKLVDANGKHISFENAVKQFTGMNMEDLNNEYLTQQSYGEMALDLGTAVVTMPAGGAGAVKLVGTAAKLGKAAKTLSNLKGMQRMANVVEKVGKGAEKAANLKSARVLTSAAGTGLLSGSVQYGIDRANLETSVSGDTIENRAAAEVKAKSTGAYGASGAMVGGTVGNITSNLTSTTGKVAANAAGYVADVAAAQTITASVNGGDFKEGLGMTAAFTGIGYAASARAAMKGKKPAVHSTGGGFEHSIGEGKLVTREAPVTGRNEIADAEVARNIDQKHLNANQRKMVEEGLADIPTPEELAAYQKEHAYQAPTPEERAALDAHQKQVRIDYADAHKIENNAVIKSKKASAVPVAKDEAAIIKLENEIKGIDGQIKDINKKIFGAQKMGKKTVELEKQLEILKGKRFAKETELNSAQKIKKNEAPAASENQPPKQPVSEPAVKTEVPKEKYSKDVKGFVEPKNYDSMTPDELVAEYQNLKEYESTGRKWYSEPSPSGKVFKINSHDMYGNKSLVREALEKKGFKLTRTYNNKNNPNIPSYSYEKSKVSVKPNEKPVSSNETFNDGFETLVRNGKTKDFSDNDLYWAVRRLEQSGKKADAARLTELRTELSARGLKIENNELRYIDPKKQLQADYKEVLAHADDAQLEAELEVIKQAKRDAVIERLQNAGMTDEIAMLRRNGVIHSSEIQAIKDRMVLGGAAAKPKNSTISMKILKMANDNLPEINPAELCREIDNGGQAIPANYIKTSREARAYLDNAITSGAYTRDAKSYIDTINQMHDISYRGASGSDFWYNETKKIRPGVPRRGNATPINTRRNSALEMEKIAKQYGDPYRLSKEYHKVKLKNIPEEGLPMDNIPREMVDGKWRYGEGSHAYPDGTHLTSYYEQMHRTSKEAIALIESGTASEKQILEKLAEHYQYAANARPYDQINNSLFMNELNTLLSKAGMKNIPNGNLDFAAMHLQPETFQKYFIDQYHAKAFNPSEVKFNGRISTDEVEVLAVLPDEMPYVEVISVENIGGGG
ncbi:LysM peptidoglycan-binding domain-containing protein [bacterium]|nr:LysM peptidoglycan-binding domain-containing protein [bacterium]